MSSRGANVAITCSSASSLADAQTLAQELLSSEHGAIAVRADLSSVDAPKAIVKATLEAFPDGVDILVNNAGTAFFKPVGDISAEEYCQVFNVNVLAPLLMLRVEDHM
ncbi:hypothetical protein MMC28_006867 [Mycoblastus sanguinarius]|nr:hypothetical protein [Mycoblastus sanguinarius]